MECPPRIADLIAQILREGILRIRSRGWDGDADACAVEADHLHDLPDLLRDFRPELLDHYLRITREMYIAEMPQIFIGPLWHELETELAKLITARSLDAHRDDQ